MKIDSTHGIGLYYMKKWDMSISDVQLIKDSIVHPQDANKTFEGSEKDSSLPDFCNNNYSDCMLPGNLRCTWFS